MRIESISFSGFRNLKDIRLSPSPRLTLIIGDNGQGKTNIVEAIYYLATLKALRAGKLDELIGWNSQVALLRGKIVEEVDRELKVRICKTGRNNTLDGKRPKSVESYSDVLKVVAFSPDDLMVVKGSASLRRKWLDRVVFTRYSSYLAEHRLFERALKSRNRLLKLSKDKGRVSPLQLEVFDEALSKHGARVCRYRLEVLSELSKIAPARFETITKSGLELSFSYKTEILHDLYNQEPDSIIASIDEEILFERLRAGLNSNRTKDLARGFTTLGPQTDDISFRIGNREARTFASQGQQRALVLALKISEIENLREVLGRTPVLLLDDVSSELDPQRNRHLIAYLSSFSGQAFVTTTDPGIAPVVEEGNTLKLFISNGAF